MEQHGLLTAFLMLFRSTSSPCLVCCSSSATISKIALTLACHVHTQAQVFGA